ncbi:hypothetical protein [Acetobacter syzygii]|uniref:hypothetical protein n=1 Tax=Acetobacter syzygii TaxID=146476 RepID=UPI0039ED654E
MPKPGEATNWIMQQYAFKDLPRTEQNEAGSFSFIWGIFENRVMQVLDRNPEESLTKSVCRDYANSEHIPKTDVSAEINYFRNLFFTPTGDETDVWVNACFRKGDKSDEIKEILLSNSRTFEMEAEALLRVISRLRNNFFHGFKWAYNLKGQLNNFVFANSALVKLMPHAP